MQRFVSYRAKREKNSDENENNTARRYRVDSKTLEVHRGQMLPLSVVVDAVVAWVVVGVDVEGTVTVDVRCPCLSRESGFRSRRELSGTTPSTGVDGVDVLVVGDISAR